MPLLLSISKYFKKVSSFCFHLIPYGVRHQFTKFIFKKLILVSPPISITDKKSKIGITTLLCHDHVFFYLLSIKSFFYFTKLNLPVFVVDDGSLTELDARLLNRHIQNISILRSSDAERTIIHKLQNYPYCLRYRKEKNLLYTHNKKLFDPIYLSGYLKFIYLDSDIIFFNKPQQIIDWSKSDKKIILHMSYSQNIIKDEDRWGLLTIKILSKLWDSDITPTFNAGLMCGYKKLFQLNIYEHYLKKMYEYSLEKTWLVEQVCHSLAFSILSNRLKRKITKSLPSNTYRIIMNASDRKNLWNNNCIHYHSEYKYHFLYYDGIKLLLRTNLFRS